MDKIQLQAVSLALRHSLRTLDAIKVGCATCAFYKGKRCEHFAAVPPAEVLPVGCDDWVFDGVPF